MTGRTSFVLELVHFRSEDEFEPHPRNETLVPFSGSFCNLQSPPSLLQGGHSWYNTCLESLVASLTYEPRTAPYTTSQLKDKYERDQI